MDTIYGETAVGEIEYLLYKADSRVILPQETGGNIIVLESIKWGASD